MAPRPEIRYRWLHLQCQNKGKESSGHPFLSINEQTVCSSTYITTAVPPAVLRQQNTKNLKKHQKDSKSKNLKECTNTLTKIHKCQPYKLIV